MRASSPLRAGGVYLFRGDRYVALHLGTDGEPWHSTALFRQALGYLAPSGLVYLRHADGVLLSAVDFTPIGVLAELVDTGETDV